MFLLGFVIVVVVVVVVAAAAAAVVVQGRLFIYFLFKRVVPVNK